VGRPRRATEAVCASLRLPCDARSRGPVAELATFAALNFAQTAATSQKTKRFARATSPGLAGRAGPWGPAVRKAQEVHWTSCVHAHLLGASHAHRGLPTRTFAQAMVALDEQRMLSRGAGLPLPRLGERAGVRGLHKSRFGETPLTPTLSPSLGRGSARYEMRSEHGCQSGVKGMGSADALRDADCRRTPPPSPLIRGHWFSWPMVIKSGGRRRGHAALCPPYKTPRPFRG